MQSLWGKTVEDKFFCTELKEISKYIKWKASEMWRAWHDLGYYINIFVHTEMIDHQYL